MPAKCFLIFFNISISKVTLLHIFHTLRILIKIRCHQQKDLYEPLHVFLSILDLVQKKISEKKKSSAWILIDCVSLLLKIGIYSELKSFGYNGLIKSTVIWNNNKFVYVLQYTQYNATARFQNFCPCLITSRAYNNSEQLKIAINK